MMTTTSCEELMNIFSKFGGKLSCDYNERTCVLHPLNYNCKIKTIKDGTSLDMILLDFQQDSYKYVSYLPIKFNNKNKEQCSNENNKLHRYQDLYTDGFEVEFYRNENGDIYSATEIKK